MNFMATTNTGVAIKFPEQFYFKHTCILPLSSYVLSQIMLQML